MLSRDSRLKKNKDFELVFKKGKGLKKGFLYFKYIKNNLKTCRFGFVISKKISKKAVVRNKIKRRLRESIKSKIPFIKESIDGIIIVLPEEKIGNYQAINSLLEEILQKAGLVDNLK